MKPGKHILSLTNYFLPCLLLALVLSACQAPLQPGPVTPTPTLPPPTFTPSATLTLQPTITPTIAPPTFTPTPTQVSFLFASMGDAQGLAENFLDTANQAAALQPDLVLFNGDLENFGVNQPEMDAMVGALQNSGLYDRTFLVRGNHDDYMLESAANWEKYFTSPSNLRRLPAGVSGLVSLSPDVVSLNYSFIYGNAIFIGLDIPGLATLISKAQLNFLEERLTHAENNGLVHAFIFFHGPLYCVESLHCDCWARTDDTCTPARLVEVINRHPIISAFFHGHEHILGWTHLDATRLPALSGSVEQFLSSPSGGGSYTANVFPQRLDYFYPDMKTYDDRGFATLSVNGNSFTFRLYKTGQLEPVWSKTFSK